MSDIYDRFVIDTPAATRAQRELLYSALTVHLRLVQQVIPAGKAWIDGSFARRTKLSPSDVDVAVSPGDWQLVDQLEGDDKAKLYCLLTLQDVAVAEPTIWLSRLQPVSGLVDAFIMRPEQESVWDEWWSKVLEPDRQVVPDQKKGYAEVTW